MELEQAHRKNIAKEQVAAVGAEEEVRQGLRQKLKERLADREENLLVDTERVVRDAGALHRAGSTEAAAVALQGDGSGAGVGGLPDSPLTADLLSESAVSEAGGDDLRSPSSADGAALRGSSLTAVPGLGGADSPLSADSSDFVSSAQKEARSLIERHQQSKSSSLGGDSDGALGGGPVLAGDDEASSARDSA